MPGIIFVYIIKEHKDSLPTIGSDYITFETLRSGKRYNSVRDLVYWSDLYATKTLKHRLEMAEFEQECADQLGLSIPLRLGFRGT